MDDVIGPVSAALAGRSSFGPMTRLDHARLVAEQEHSLGSPRRRYSLSARVLFALMDRIYGKQRTMEKFRVLELVARVPYQAWENVAYVAVTHTASAPGFANRIFGRVRAARWEQDNEQWHLLILEDLTSGDRASARQGFVRSRIVPQLIAFVYYQLSWFMYVAQPRWSYRLNADFEDHAEHEYALFVAEHPGWEHVAHDGHVGDGQSGDGQDPPYDSLADLFRQICYDERLHKLESEANLRRPRFT